MSLSRMLGKAISIIAFVIFVTSIIFPFLYATCVHAMQIGKLLVCKIKLWSFRGCYECEHSVSEAWFYDFWFKDQFIARYGLSWPLTFLFIAQILTLSTSVVFIFTNRRIFALLPTISCPLVTGLMIYLFVRFSEPPFYWLDYMQGYWLTYLSEVIFIINVLLQQHLKRIS